MKVSDRITPSSARIDFLRPRYLQKLFTARGSTLQGIHIFASFGPCRASSASPGINAETNHLAQLFARLLRLLSASFRHASRLGDHVCEDRKIGKHDEGYHPDRLAPAGYVVTPKQVAYDDDEQPEPQHDAVNFAIISVLVLRQRSRFGPYAIA
jgi:hypothetical protein